MYIKKEGSATMAELAAQYRRGAEDIRVRMEELERRRRKLCASDSAASAALQTRILSLKAMFCDTVLLARYMETYPSPSGEHQGK